MEGTDIPVTLIIKAPSLNDQTIQCARNWTVERLKRHIRDVYPTKPSPSEQRLIYYGQLLSDSETLNDVFTRFEEGETVHTVHLMCIPSRESMRTPVVTSPPAPSPQPSIAPQTPEDAYRYYANPAGYEHWMNDANSGYFQQLAWAQQAYAQYYFSQYMNTVAREQGAAMVPGAEADGAHEAPRAPEPVPLERGDDDERNRDWLDCIYLMARVVVLFSIVYFYSSPIRFVAVSFLGLVMYLYQIGFFRAQNLPVPENNAGLNNNLPAENNNLPQAQADEGQASQPPPEPVRPSLLTVWCTFFFSFFESLIPENIV